MSTDITNQNQGTGNVLEPLVDRRSHPGFAGPLQLIDKMAPVSITSPQTRDVPVSDSRLTKTYWRLTDHEARELKLDPTITLVRELVLSPAVATPWTVEEKENAPEGAAKLLTESFFPHRLMFLQSAFFGCMDFGWAPFEVVWGLDKEGNVVPSWIKQLLHEWTWILVYLNTGELWGFTNEPVGFDISSIIGPEKALNINLEVEGTDWYGVGSLVKTNKIQSQWNDVNTSANTFDRKIAGAHWIVYFPVGETPYGESKTPTRNDTIAREILNTLEASGSTAIPDEVQEWMDDDIDKETKGKWRVELLSAGASVNAQFTDRLKYLDNLKVRAFGVPERAILEGKFGTKAEADTHAEAGISNIDRKHRLIVDQLNKHTVNQFLKTNYGEEFENSVFIQVSPLIDARFTLLREAFSRMLQDSGALRGLANMIDVRAMTEELGVPLQAGADQLEIEDPMPTNTFGGNNNGSQSSGSFGNSE